MFRIAICDDMQPQATELAKMLTSLAGEIPMECEVEVFRSFKLLQKALSENSYQLLFLETRLGGISGIDFARRLRVIDEEIDIVFCSTESESALAAYTVFPVGYLTKPVDGKKLRDVFRHVADKYRQKPSIVLRGIDGGERSICVDDILYIEVFGEVGFLSLSPQLYRELTVHDGNRTVPVPNGQRRHRCRGKKPICRGQSGV